MKPFTSSPQPTRSVLERVSRTLRAFVGSVLGRAALLALTAWGTFALWNWVTTESVEEQRAGDLSSPIKAEGVKSFVVRKDGQKHWEVVADSAQVVDNGEAWLALGVSRGTLFREDKPWITMSAPRVRYSNSSKNLDAVGGVKASGPERFSFSTPQARWLDAKKTVEIPGAVSARLREMEFSLPNLGYQWERGELSCPGQVEVRVKGGVLRGRQMTANVNARQVDLARDVELIFVPGVAKLPRPFVSDSPVAATPAAFAAVAVPGAAGARPLSMSRSRLLRATLTLAAAPPAAMLVQANIAPPALAAPSAKTPGNVVIKSGPTSYSDANGVTSLSGGVTIAEVGKKFVLSAQNAIYDQPKSQASAKGNLEVKTPNSTIRGAELFGDFNKKLLSISGNVVISAYDKGNGMSGFRSSAARKPVRIACNRLDWDYTKQQATLVGNLRVVQGDNSGTCDTLVYDEPRNIVYLKGNVRFGNSKRQQFVGNEVTVWVDKGLVSAPNVTIRGGLDSAPQTPATPSAKAPARPAPAIPAAPNLPADIPLPQAPPPIESLIPKSTPLVRSKPTLPPLPAKTPPEPDAPKPEPQSEAPDKSTSADAS